MHLPEKSGNNVTRIESRYMKKYDFIVIGSGSGGSTAAILAAQRQSSVALIERHQLGGSNLHWGCIPIKSLVSSAKMLLHARHGEDYGVNIPHVSATLGTWVNRQRLVIAKLAEEMDRTLHRNGVEVLRGTASFESMNILRVRHNGHDEIIEGKKIIIATGSHPVPFAAIDEPARALVGLSNDFVHLTTLPPRLLIIGGGYIGCELGGVYSTLGCKVTIVEAGSHILPEIEPEAGEYLQGKFEQSGVRVILNSRVTRISLDDSSSRAVAHLESGQTLQEEKVLVSIGRQPSLDHLNLDKVGITHGRAIEVNEHLQTNLRHIYAIGDVNGRCALSHSASAQAEVAISHALGDTSSMDFSHIPFCVLTNPEISAVGLSEEKAVAQGLKVRVGRCPFRNVGRALAIGELEGFVKLVAEEESGRILGGLVIGPHASEHIAPITLALKLGATAHQLARSICARPTLSEAVQEAARRIISAPLLSI